MLSSLPVDYGKEPCQSTGLPGLSLQDRRRRGRMLVQTLSSVAQQRRELGALHTRYRECAAVLANAFSPTTSYFCFLKERLSAIAKGEELIFQSHKGEEDWVGGSIRWEFSHAMLFPFHSSGRTLYCL